MTESALTVYNNRPKLTESTTGISVVRGSSLLGTGLFQSIQDSYVNLSQNGIVVIYLGILAFASIAEFSGTTGPLELMKDALDAIIKNGNEHSLILHLASALSKLLGFLISYKVRFISIGWMWFPYLAKPSSKNLWVSVFLSLFALFSTSFDILEIVLIANSYFLWAALRSPSHKTIFLIVTLILLIISLDVNFHKINPKADSLNKLHSSNVRKT